MATMPNVNKRCVMLVESVDNFYLNIFVHMGQCHDMANQNVI